LIGRKCFHVHLDEAHKWAAKVGVIATASIHDDTYCDKLAAVRRMGEAMRA